MEHRSVTAKTKTKMEKNTALTHRVDKSQLKFRFEPLFCINTIFLTMVNGLNAELA